MTGIWGVYRQGEVMNQKCVLVKGPEQGRGLV
jgi:hypothetical protein